MNVTPEEEKRVVDRFVTRMLDGRPASAIDVLLMESESPEKPCAFWDIDYHLYDGMYYCIPNSHAAELMGASPFGRGDSIIVGAGPAPGPDGSLIVRLH